MNFNEFAASFKNPEGVSCYKPENQQEGDVVLAGTILHTTDEFCCISINGAQYEIAAHDVIDIQPLSPVAAPTEEKADTEEAQAEDVSEKQGPQTVLVKVKRNAILICRTPVPAKLLAAVGTWMEVVIPAGKAA
jgi:hypothetical protein